ncbi:hypothetical protein PZB75_18525 [Streptomyces sp. AM 4-1-1]|uniref:hypothetical protein n=1 Tax=Streptomyces sp. AM 4-1-1 TaxID=3028710 RepID=UPI0023B98C97|nr:hypothetical protein [Streptomyces sp. AM 4-1-1]WEH35179.1 hypothetical protein PZB75_18525 [Streptomyces sp. AM 4-1-1]
MATPPRPDYPPRTPPPPKKPVEPPRPSPGKRLVPGPRQPVSIRNRRCRNWQLESQPWTAGAAGTRIVGALRQWGYGFAEDTVIAAVTLLVNSAVRDGGTRISVHLADERNHAAVLVLSHGPTPAPVPAPLSASADESLLRDIAALGFRECGIDTGADGRRLWALVELSGRA